jgi:hypothetical protein
MANTSDVAELKACVEACADGDDACVTACKTTFRGKGGKASKEITEGGKVFTDAKGGKVFVSNGGKVF